MDDALVPAHHHRLLIEQLHKVERGELLRLMVFWPPGHAKSKYSSEYGPAWWIGRNKKKTIIHASYGTDFAERFGRKIRNIVRSQEFERVFGVTLAADSRAAGEWETVEGGEYKAAGVGAGITGRRADLGLIDDPVKSRKEADSPTYRQNAWDWYLADFRTRLKPGGAVVIIQTRWHEDDLSGRILPKDYDGRSGWVTARDGEQWFVLNFPAICEREDDLSGRKIGDALWPGYITLPMLEQLKKTQGSRNWDALYQQRPRPGEGGIFKEAWTRNRYGQIPAEANVVVHSWDTAQKPDQLNDPSALSVWNLGRGAPGYYLREVWAKQVDYPTLKHKVLAFADRDRPAAILIEDKSSGQSLIQELRNSTSLPIIAIEPLGDKTFRANEVSAMVEAGLVHLPEPGIMSADGGSARYPWLIDFESEFFGFPLATHDDQVDTVTQFLKWVRGWSGEIQSVGAGMTRTLANEVPVSEIGNGFGSVSRGVDMSGF